MSKYEISPTTASTYSMPRLLLRLEGAALLVGSALTYFRQGGSWGMFLLLLLAPELSMLGYLANPHVGSVVYNLAHTYVLPLTLAGIGFFISSPLCVLLALIWAAHIGMDRLLGYGLKYPTAFTDTHLQRV
jgi:hypothetical protein